MVDFNENKKTHIRITKLFIYQAYTYNNTEPFREERYLPFCFFPPRNFHHLVIFRIAWVLSNGNVFSDGTPFFRWHAFFSDGTLFLDGTQMARYFCIMARPWHAIFLHGTPMARMARYLANSEILRDNCEMARKSTSLYSKVRRYIRKYVVISKSTSLHRST